MNTFCSYYNQGLCRSCDLIEYSYVDQIHQKEKILRDSLRGLEYPSFEKTVESQAINFRNKAKFVVTGTIDSPKFGLTGSGDLDNGQDLSHCLLHNEAIAKAIPSLKEFLRIANLHPYRISEKKGELKGIIIFSALQNEDMYLRLVLRSKEPIDRIRKHLSFLQVKIPNLKVVSVNIQPVPHAILEGDEEIILSVDQTIRYRINGIDFPLAPKSFVQTNQAVAEKLYLEANTWLTEIKTKKLIELFCGQGFFTFLAKGINESIGIEINKDAVDAANAFAEKQSLKDVRFIHSDAGKVSEVILTNKPDTILVNPPRKGLGGALELVKNSEAQYVVYSSCNYETLADDLKKMSDCYQIQKIKIFDMFPQTKHFETLVLLKKLSSDG